MRPYARDRDQTLEAKVEVEAEVKPEAKVDLSCLLAEHICSVLYSNFSFSEV